MLPPRTYRPTYRETDTRRQRDPFFTGGMTHRKRRPLAALTPVIAVALISGCGSTAPIGSGSSDPAASNHAKAVKFSECMRANGVSNFRTRTRRAT